MDGHRGCAEGCVESTWRGTWMSAWMNVQWMCGGVHREHTEGCMEGVVVLNETKRWCDFRSLLLCMSSLYVIPVVPRT